MPADDPSLFWSLAYHCARCHLPLCVPTSLVDVVVAGPSEAAAVALARRATARQPTVDVAVVDARAEEAYDSASELSVGRFDDLLVSRLEADSDAASSVVVERRRRARAARAAAVLGEHRDALLRPRVLGRRRRAVLVA